MIDKREISGKDGGPIDYRDVSEEEIERHIIETILQGKKRLATRSARRKTPPLTR